MSFICSGRTQRGGDTMDNVINMEDYKLDKNFDNQAISYFHTLNMPFQYFKDQGEAVFILKTHAYLFIFTTYIKKEVFTSLPSIKDRFLDIKNNPRTSTGEWVVEHIYELDEKQAKKFMKKLSDYKEDKNCILELKKRIKK